MNDRILFPGERAKVTAVCERLVRLPTNVLSELLAYEKTRSAADSHVCCQGEALDGDDHKPTCSLHKLLTGLGLPDRKSRDYVRAALGAK